MSSIRDRLLNKNNQSSSSGSSIRSRLLNDNQISSPSSSGIRDRLGVSSVSQEKKTPEVTFEKKTVLSQEEKDNIRFEYNSNIPTWEKELEEKKEQYELDKQEYAKAKQESLLPRRKDFNELIPKPGESREDFLTRTEEKPVDKSQFMKDYERLQERYDLYNVEVTDEGKINLTDFQIKDLSSIYKSGTSDITMDEIYSRNYTEDTMNKLVNEMDYESSQNAAQVMADITSGRLSDTEGVILWDALDGEIKKYGLEGNEYWETKLKEAAKQHQIENIDDSIKTMGKIIETGDATIGAGYRGYYNSKIAKKVGDLITVGKYDEAQKYIDENPLKLDLYGQMQEDGMDVEHPGSYSGYGISSGVFEMLGQQASQINNPLTAVTTVVGGAITTIAGAGPVPGAKVGLMVGGATNAYEIESGYAFIEMTDAGISPDLAADISRGIGVVNAGLEFAQLDELFKIAKKTGTTDSTKKLITTYLSSVVTEALQETAQEGVTIAGTNIGKHYEGQELDDLNTVISRLGETFTSSLITFGILAVPGSVKGSNNQNLSRAVPVDVNADGKMILNEEQEKQYTEEAKQWIDKAETVGELNVTSDLIKNSILNTDLNQDQKTEILEYLAAKESKLKETEQQDISTKTTEVISENNQQTNEIKNQNENNTKIQKEITTIDNEINVLIDQLTTAAPIGTVDIDGIYTQLTDLREKRQKANLKLSKTEKIDKVSKLEKQINKAEKLPESVITEKDELKIADKTREVQEITQDIEKGKTIKPMTNKQFVEQTSQQSDMIIDATIQEMNANSDIQRSGKEITRVTELTPDQKRVQEVANAFGKQVAFLKNADFAAVVMPHKGSVIFMNDKIDSSLILSNNKNTQMLYTIGHELFHSLKMTDKETYGQFIDFVKNDISQEQLTEFMEKYDPNDTMGLLKGLQIDGKFDINAIKEDPKKYKKQNAILNYISEEIVANEFGGMLTDEEYMNKLNQTNPNLFNKIVESIRKFFNDITDSVYESSLTQMQIDNIRLEFENIVKNIETTETTETVKENKNAFDTDDKYIYHVDATNADKNSFKEKGIIASREGQSGPGVYMANKIENTQYYTDEDNKGTMYKIDKQKLIDKYGLYHHKNNPDGRLQFDEETGEIYLEGNESISPDLIEFAEEPVTKNQENVTEEKRKVTKEQIEKARKEKQIVHTTNALQDIMDAGKIDGKNFSVAVQDIGSKIVRYGKQGIKFKPEILNYVNNEGMYIGDGGTRRTQTKGNKNKFKSVDELLNDKPKYYNEITFNEDIPLDMIEEVSLPNTTDKKLIKQLKDAGVKVQTYDDRLPSNIPSKVKRVDSTVKESMKEGQKVTKMNIDDRYSHIEKTLDKYQNEKDVKKKNAISNSLIKAYNNYKKDGGNKTNKVLDDLIKADFKKQMKEKLAVKKLPSKIKDKESKLYTNTATNSKLFTDIVEAAKTNPELKKYTSTTRQKDTQSAISRIKGQGENAPMNFLAKDRLDSVDTQVAKILMTYYKAKGDVDSEIAIYNRIRQESTKSGQFIESIKSLKDLSPAAVVNIIQSDLDRATSELENSRDPIVKAWLKENLAKTKLTQAEREWVYQMAAKASKMEFDSPQYRQTYALINAFVADRIPKSISAKVKSFRRMAMLFNPKTMTRNFLGNKLMELPNMLADFAGSRLDATLAKKSGIRTQGTLDTKAYREGKKIGISEAKQDRDLGINTRRTNPFEMQEGKTWNNETKTGKALNWVEKWMNYALDRGDRPFEEAIYYNSLANQMRLNNVEVATETMKEIAQAEADKKTWKNSGKMAKVASKTREVLNTAHIGEMGLGDLVLPFVMTPANLAVATYDYSPAAVISVAKNAKKYSEAMKSGKDVATAQKAFVDSFGKAVTGTLLYAVAYAIAKSGAITGGEDEDKDVRAMMRAQGFQPYSIKIGDKYYSYDWAQPIANPFAVMAELHRQAEISKNTPGGDKANNAFKAITEAFTIGGDRLYEQSFLKSINTLLSAESPQEGLIDFAVDIPSSFVPTLFKQIADVTDGGYKATYDSNNLLSMMFDKVLAKIPGAKSTLPTKRDTLGKEIEMYGGQNGLINSFINPGRLSKDTAGAIGNEIMDVYNNTGDAAIMPQVAPTSMRYDINGDGELEKIDFDTSQQAVLQERMGTIVADGVDSLLNNDVYQNASYEEKATALTSLVQYAKAKAIEESGYVEGYEIKSGNALQIDNYHSKGLSIPEAVLYDSMINPIKSLKDVNGDSIPGSQNGQKAYIIDNMQISNYSKNIMLQLISPTAKNPETVDSLQQLYTQQDFIDYYTLPRSDYMVINNYSRDDYDMATKYYNISGTDFANFSNQLATLKSDYDKNGEVIEGSKKAKVTQYINSLDLSVAQKVYLYKNAGYSVSAWKSQMYNYINSKDISADEKYQMWTSLGFK